MNWKYKFATYNYGVERECGASAAHMHKEHTRAPSLPDEIMEAFKGETRPRAEGGI